MTGTRQHLLPPPFFPLLLSSFSSSRSFGVARRNWNERPWSKSPTKSSCGSASSSWPSGSRTCSSANSASSSCTSTKTRRNPTWRRGKAPSKSTSSRARTARSACPKVGGFCQIPLKSLLKHSYPFPTLIHLSGYNNLALSPRITS